MATLTATPSQASDSPSLLPVARTDEPASGWFVLGTWLTLTVVALGFVAVYGQYRPMENGQDGLNLFCFRLLSRMPARKSPASSERYDSPSLSWATAFSKTCARGLLDPPHDRLDLGPVADHLRPHLRLIGRGGGDRADGIPGPQTCTQTDRRGRLQELTARKSFAHR
jgi:hypothetical protein